MTLEQQLNDLAEANGLTSIAVGRLLVGERIVYRASVHYDGHAKDGINCSSGLSDRDIQDALHKAIMEAADNRTPPVVAPGNMLVMEIAA